MVLQGIFKGKSVWHSIKYAFRLDSFFGVLVNCEDLKEVNSTEINCGVVELSLGTTFNFWKN